MAEIDGNNGNPVSTGSPAGGNGNGNGKGRLTALIEDSKAVRERGADLLRGGAFKPRTSPYDFQGLGVRGLKFLAEARERTGLPIVTEVLSWEEVPVVARYADMLQIGARNMQNFALLRAAGRSGKPILLKRGAGATIEEWLHAAEYVLAHGNENVVLCERGIRTFERATQFLEKRRLPFHFSG